MTAGKRPPSGVETRADRDTIWPKHWNRTRSNACAAAQRVTNIAKPLRDHHGVKWIKHNSMPTARAQPKLEFI